MDLGTPAVAAGSNAPHVAVHNDNAVAVAVAQTEGEGYPKEPG